MKFVIWFVVIFNLALAATAGGAFFFAYNAWTGPGPYTETKDIIIAKGQGVSGIADQLSNEGVIRSSLIFKVAARLSGDSSLKAGEYEFAPEMKMKDILAKIAKGDVVDRKVTVPEGRTSWQIVQMVNKADAMKGTIAETPKDGTLLPQTYAYTRDEDRAQMVKEMQDAMTKTIKELWPAREEGLPFKTPEEALTLASIVEKETGVGSERSRIAGVFLNRLKTGMPLQSDPTVIYAMTKGEVKDEGQGPLGRRLLRTDLENTDSPYNTYKYPGLPPGPIANPGRAAIEAVLHPEHHDFLYFVANGSGGHIFASTLAEHEKNAADWRQIRKEQGN